MCVRTYLNATECWITSKWCYLVMYVLSYSNFGCYVVGVHMDSAGLIFCNATVWEPVKEKRGWYWTVWYENRFWWRELDLAGSRSKCGVWLWNLWTVSCKSCIPCEMNSKAAALYSIDPQNRFCVLWNKHSGSPAINRCTSHSFPSLPNGMFHVLKSFWQRCHTFEGMQ